MDVADGRMTNDGGSTLIVRRATRRLHRGGKPLQVTNAVPRIKVVLRRQPEAVAIGDAPRVPRPVALRHDHDPNDPRA